MAQIRWSRDPSVHARQRQAHLDRASDAGEELGKRQRQRDILLQQVLCLRQACDVFPLHPQRPAACERCQPSALCLTHIMEPQKTVLTGHARAGRATPTAQVNTGKPRENFIQWPGCHLAAQTRRKDGAHVSMMSRLNCSTSSRSCSPKPRRARGVPASPPEVLPRLAGPLLAGRPRRLSTLAGTAVLLSPEGRRCWEPTAQP